MLDSLLRRQLLASLNSIEFNSPPFFLHVWHGTHPGISNARLNFYALYYAIAATAVRPISRYVSCMNVVCVWYSLTRLLEATETLIVRMKYPGIQSYSKCTGDNLDVGYLAVVLLGL